MKTSGLSELRSSLQSHELPWLSWAWPSLCEYRTLLYLTGILSFYSHLHCMCLLDLRNLHAHARQIESK